MSKQENTGTESKHTPGPWRVVGNIKGHNLAMWIFGPDPSPGEKRELQIISMKDSHVDKQHLERRKADFILMASAPTLKSENEKLQEQNRVLLEAVKVALWDLDNGEMEAQRQGKPRLSERRDIYARAINKQK